VKVGESSSDTYHPPADRSATVWSGGTAPGRRAKIGVVTKHGWFCFDDTGSREVLLSEGVIRLLFSDGVIDQLRQDAGLTYEMDAYEQDDLPPLCLGALAASSRRAAARYAAAPSLRRVTWESWSLVDGRAEEALEVKASDVHDTLVRLAELAEYAGRRNMPLYVSL